MIQVIVIENNEILLNICCLFAAVHAPYPRQFASSVQQLPAPLLQPRPPPPSQFQEVPLDKNLSYHRAGQIKHIQGKKSSFEARTRAISINKRLTNARVPQVRPTDFTKEYDVCA